MRRLFPNLAHDRRGNAAVELAMILPLVLVLLSGSAELGNYFMNEHGLVKAVRDGARFAARQDFSNYPDCGTVSASAQDATKNVVVHGYLSGGTAVTTPNISDSDIVITTTCSASENGQDMLGIYSGRSTGAQVVMVHATVPYLPILSAFGFTGLNFTLNADSQAAVTGI